MKDGAIRLEDLPEDIQKAIIAGLPENLQTEIMGVLSTASKGKKPKLGEPLDKGAVLLAATRVMEALRKSKAPTHQWYRILGQCQRWCRNPSRLYGAKKAPKEGLRRH